MRRGAAWATAGAAALLAAFAWGLSQVVVEARGYAAVHGLPADTSTDQATVVAALLLAAALAATALLLHRPRPVVTRPARG